MERPEHAGRLRLLRLQKFEAAKDLAAALGWHASKVSRIERGQQLPTYDDVYKWTLVCGGVETEAKSIFSQVRKAHNARSCQPMVMGVTVSDRAMHRLIGWASDRGYTVDEAIIVLLGHWEASDERN